jgi:tetratricopeptide (TPR) repeat protein
MMRTFALAAGVAAILIVPNPSLAAGAAGGGGGASAQAQCQKGFAWNAAKKKCLPLCKKGEMFSAQQNKCVKQQAGRADDNELKSQGWALARAGDYEEAIALFSLSANPRDPEVLNGLGYSHRKLGLLTEAIGYYRRALALDPSYVLAREYLGEGYVAAGKIELAKEQLQEIASRCGLMCESYVDLASAIEEAKP